MNAIMPLVWEGLDYLHEHPQQTGIMFINPVSPLPEYYTLDESAGALIQADLRMPPGKMLYINWSQVLLEDLASQTLTRIFG